jgi:hypothetical protein
MKRWIDEARDFYTAQPWICWSLGMGVPVCEPIYTLSDAGNAIAWHVGVDAIGQVIRLHLAQTIDREAVRTMLLLKLVAAALIRMGRITAEGAGEVAEREMDAAGVPALEARGG